LGNYLANSSAAVDSVWKNIDWEYQYDSIVMSTNQYYLYLSVLKGGDFTYRKLDSLYINGKINTVGLEVLQNTCASRGEFMVFKGV
jgi:hypothetical protein